MSKELRDLGEQIMTNELHNLGVRLKDSLALNSLEQAIIKIDVAIEGMQRLLDDVKRIKDKIEEYK